jgi:hypothetical protein
MHPNADQLEEIAGAISNQQEAQSRYLSFGRLHVYINERRYIA